jgi:hypothetical protein
LTQEQRRDVEEDLRGEEQRKRDSLRKLHRIILVPTQGTAITKEMDLGIPDVSERKSIIDEAYDGLKSEGEIIEKISPLVIKERYLKDRDYTKVQQIYDSMMKTPGAVRYAKRNTIEDSLIEGIKQGYFGSGEIQRSNNGEGKEMPFCRTFKEEISIIDPNSVILADRICEAQRKADKNDGLIVSTPTEIGDQEGRRTLGVVEVNVRQDVGLSFDVPRGKISHIMGIINLLQQKFESIHLEIKAQKGSISEDDYDSKIKEALRQMGIEIN